MKFIAGERDRLLLDLALRSLEAPDRQLKADLDAGNWEKMLDTVEQQQQSQPNESPPWRGAIALPP